MEDDLGLLLKRVDSKPPSSAPRATFSAWSAASEAAPRTVNAAPLALWLCVHSPEGRHGRRES